MFVENSGAPFLDEMIAMMYQYPQLYGDLSTITWIIPRSAFHRYVEALVRAGLGNRLMFGSDQMRWPEKIDEAIEAIEEADYLTAAQKRDIFYNNAARFLRLEGDVSSGRGCPRVEEAMTSRQPGTGCSAWSLGVSAQTEATNVSIEDFRLLHVTEVSSLGMIASSAPGMAACSCSATCTGLRRSMSPHSNSVGT